MKGILDRERDRGMIPPPGYFRKLLPSFLFKPIQEVCRERGGNFIRIFVKDSIILFLGAKPEICSGNFSEREGGVMISGSLQIILLFYFLVGIFEREVISGSFWKFLLFYLYPKIAIL